MRLRGWGIALLLLVCACGAAAGQSAGRRASRVAASPAPSMRPAPSEEEEAPLPFLSRSRKEGAEEAPSLGGLLMRTAGALFFIVGLIVAAAWGLRQLRGVRGDGLIEDAPAMVVLGTVPLGDRRSLAAVRFGERILLLGATPQSITLLASQRRRVATGTPPMRSVAELLREDDAPAFDAALAQADQQLEWRNRLPRRESE